MVVRKRKRAIAKAKKNLEIHEQNKIAHHAIDELIQSIYVQLNILSNTIISSLNEPVNSYKRYNIIDSDELKTFRQSKLNDYKRYNIINETELDLTIDEPFERKQFIDYETELANIGIRATLNLLPNLSSAKQYYDKCMSFNELLLNGPNGFRYKGLFKIAEENDNHLISEIYQTYYEALDWVDMYAIYTSQLERYLMQENDKYQQDALEQIIQLTEDFEI